MSLLNEKLGAYTQQLNDLKNEPSEPEHLADESSETGKLISQMTERILNSSLDRSKNEIYIVEDIPTDENTGNKKQYTNPTTVIFDDSKRYRIMSSLYLTADQEPLDHTRPLIQQEKVDGTFTPDLDKIKKQNTQRLANRLLRDPDGHLFFNEDGTLNIDPIVVKPVASDHLIPRKYRNDADVLNPIETEINYVTAEFWEPDDTSVHNIIKVHIKDIKFTVNEFTSIQHTLTCKLESVYKQYQEAISIDKCGYYATRVKALRRSLKKGAPDEGPILMEIIDCVQNLDNETCGLRKLRDTLVTLWKQLKDVSSRTYNETGVKLKWLSHKYTPEEVKKAEEEYEKELTKRAKEIKRLRKLSGDVMKEDKKEIVEILRKQHHDTGMPLPGDTEWKPELNYDEISNPSNLSQDELERMNNAEDTGIFVRVRFGDAKITSPTEFLTQNMIAPMDFGTNFVVTRIPKFAMVEVWQSNHKGVKRIASLSMPVFNGETKEFAEFQFSGTTPLKDGRIVQGCVIGRAFIATNPMNDVSKQRTRLGLSPAERAVNKTNMPINTMKLMKEDPFRDPNDPYTTEAISKVIPVVDQAASKFAIDENERTTLLASMAPPDDHKHLVEKIKPPVGRVKQPFPVGYDDVIIAQKQPKLIEFFHNLFSRKRLLKPGAGNKPLEGIGTFTSLHVAIHGFRNEPLRNKMCMIPSTLSSKGFESPDNLKPSIFIIGTLLNEKHETLPVRTDDGRYPADMQFDVSVSPEALASNLTLRVFDRVQYTFPEQGKRSENHFLGSISIPIQSIEANCQSSGVYRLESPLIQMAYDVVDEFAVELTFTFIPKFSRNRVMPTFTYVNGDETPLHLMILPSGLNLPEKYDNLGAVVRFVSMIEWTPSKDPLKFSKTSQDFLSYFTGSGLDHCILLCNYITKLGQDSYVILVNDLFQGDGAFVFLTDSSGATFFIDAVKGETYIDDPPFDNIFLAFNSSNIYEHLVPGIDMDLGNSETWKKSSPPGVSPQESFLRYDEPLKHVSHRLIKKLKKSLKEFVQEIVKEDISWNKSLSKNIEALLESCQESVVSGIPAKSSDFWTSDGNVRINGSPFCVPYKEDAQTFENLFYKCASKIESMIGYIMEGPEYQLGIGVKGFVEAHGVASVWVFIATAQPLPSA